MPSKRKLWKPWGDHPIVVFIFVVAALITIAVFLKDYLTNQNPLTISIRVANQAGSSISNAKVILLYSEGAVSQYTDVNGTVTFSLSIDDPKGLRAVVETEGYQIYETQIRTPSSDVVNIRLEERKGSRTDILLRVVDNETEVPISDAPITLVANGDIHKEISDSDGFAQFTLDFPVEGKLDAEISVIASEYRVEKQIRTLLPGKLQYILLSPSSLTVEVPNIPTAVPEPTDAEAAENSPQQLNGSGVEMAEEATGSGLRVIILKPDSRPWEGVYVEIYEQLADVNGNPVRGNRVQNGRINQQGLLDFDLSEGIFVMCVEVGASPGYAWTDQDCIYGLEISSGKLKSVKLQPGQLEVAIAGASGEPWQGIYYEVFTQKKDVSGNPVIDNRVASGRTDNAGVGYAILTPGLYTLSLDLRGYNWGNLQSGKGQLNITIMKGQTNRINIRLGQLLIGLRDPSGQPATNIYMEVFTQKDDINDQHILADRVWDGRTDIGGFAKIDLTKGLYALKIGENILYDISIEEGKITETDGSSVAK